MADTTRTAQGAPEGLKDLERDSFGDWVLQPDLPFEKRAMGPKQLGARALNYTPTPSWMGEQKPTKPDLITDEHGDVVSPALPPGERGMGPKQAAAKQAARESGDAQSRIADYHQAALRYNRPEFAPDIQNSLAPEELAALVSLQGGKSKIDEAAANAPSAGPAPTMQMPEMTVLGRGTGVGGSGGAGGSGGPAMKMPEMDIQGRLPAAPGTGGSGGGAPPPEAPSAAPAAPSKSPDELAYEAAQKEADSSKGRLLAADILGSFTSNPERLWKGIEEQRQAPYKKLAEKVAFLQQAKENTAKNVRAQREVETADPNSATTKRNAAMLYGAYGIKVPQGFTAEQTADYVAATKLTGEQKEKELTRLREEARDKETARLQERGQNLTLQAAREGNAADIAKARLAADGKGAASKVPAELAAKLGGYDSANKLIDNLDKDWNEKSSGAFAGIAQKLPGTDASKYIDARDVAAKAIGKEIEGGKMTDQDVVVIKGMLPLAGDSRATKDFKLKKLREYVQTKKENELRSLGQAGYNIDNFSSPASQAASSVPAAKHPQANAALAWARANPNAPEAQEILQRLGGG